MDKLEALELIQGGNMKYILEVFKDKEVKFKKVDGELYMNVNSIAKPKTIENWKASANTARYINALANQVIKFREEELTLDNIGLNASSLKFREDKLIETIAGSHSGTWIHEKLILCFARYISVEFEIWADNIIKKVLEDGYYISEKMNIEQINKLKQDLNNMELDLNLVKTSLAVARNQRDEYESRLNSTDEYVADYRIFSRRLMERDETIKNQNKMLAIAGLKIKNLEKNIDTILECNSL